jgi:hypothetical protein
MSFNFVADRVIRDKAYPALTQHSAEPYTPEWREFVQHWPNTVPCELHEHCVTHGYPCQLYNITDNFPENSFYTIGLGFFNFNIDYFKLLPNTVTTLIYNNKLRLLFYYHEGDNPYLIKQRLDTLCQAHGLNLDCYRFVSGNSAADNIEKFAWFPDHELLYWHRNREHLPVPISNTSKKNQFTLLSRTHKWWRATVVSDLHRSGLLKNSQWSYNTIVDIADRFEDNPIEIDTLNLREYLINFINNGPYLCDHLSVSEHNDHSLLVAEHFVNSYFSVVLETHFDADSSAGTFLTEKTFKCLKHGHPFVLVAPQNSLQKLRDLGYRTFDHAIDNTYDTISDNTQRWQAIKNTILQLTNVKNMDQWFDQCHEDLNYNQALYSSNKYNRIDNLYKKIINESRQ